MNTQFQCQKQFYFKQISLSKVQRVLFQTVQLRIISTQFQCKKKLFFFKQFSLAFSTQFSSIWPIDRTLSGATSPGQSEPGSDGNEGVLRIPQSSRITRISPSDFLVSYPGHSLGVGGSYSSAKPTEQINKCILVYRWICIYILLNKVLHWKSSWLYWCFWLGTNDGFYIIFHSYFHYINSLLGARGVMVIVVGNGHGDTSSNPGWDWLYFT